MSLDVAIQSVVFYVLSCSTCAKINHRRKAKVQAKKERKEKHELETEQPGLYRHPSPFNTNPYWTEEIMMGPGPPKKNSDKNGSKNASQRALNTAGQGSSYASSGATDTPSSPTAVEGSRISGEGWNLKRYQREDEALWGHDVQGPGQRIMGAIAKAGSTAGRLLEGRLSKSGPSVDENPKSYYLAKNPPVNDLHPPVVSTQPASRDETRWMLQPPPSAKVMEGKERVNRNRADSNGSSRKGGDVTPLSRQVTERLVDAKLQRGETPSYPELRSQAQGALAPKPHSSLPKGQRHERDRSPSWESSESSDGAGMRRKRKPYPISISPVMNSSRDTIEHTAVPASSGVRPPLSTIVSSSNVVPRVAHSTSSDLVLRDLPPSSTNSAMNPRSQSPTNRLSPNANSMPASIPSVESKFPGAQTFVFPKPKVVEDTLAARGEAAKARASER